jgi:hypothetical protein
MSDDWDIPWMDPGRDLISDEDTDHFHDRCGHFHGDGLCPDPDQPCGDYRCCIN